MKCKASATFTVRGVCFFTLLAQASCPLAASILLISAHAGSWHGMPHFPIPPHQGRKSSEADLENVMTVAHRAWLVSGRGQT